MKMDRSCATFAVILLILVPTLPCVAASGAVAAFLEVQDRDVNHAGDVVNVTLHVFERGVRLGPTSAQVLAGATSVPVSEASPGRLVGTYVIQEADSQAGSVRFTATVTYSTETVTDTVLLPVSSDTIPGNLSLRLGLDEAGDWTPAPGTRLEFTAKVAWAGLPIDPDTVGNFSLTYRTPPGVTAPAPQRLMPVRAAMGVYAGVHVLNASLAVDHRLVIALEVAHLGEMQRASLEVPVAIFQVWAHGLTADGGSISFDVCATDSDGRALEGALIALASPGPEVAATDQEGRARVTVAFDAGRAPLDLAGTVAHRGSTQHFSMRWRGILSGTEGFAPRAGALDLRWAGVFTGFRPSEQINARYRVFNDTAAWASRPVHYYGQATDITMTHAGPVLFSGGATTDALGDFSFSFRAPSREGFVRVVVRAPTGTDVSSSDGLSYREDVDLIPVVDPALTPPRDPEIVLPAPDLKLGAPTRVVMESPLTTDLAATLTWELPSMDWARLTPPLRAPMNREAAGFVGLMHVPACLPADATVRLVVTATETTSGRTWANFVDVTPVPPPPPAGTDLSIPLALVTLLAATIVAVALVRRRSRPE